MGIIKISDHVYSIGVMNPSLRVFDIVMESQYGTSYNSYLLTIGNKNVLMDTVHEDYFEEYLYNIQCLVDIQSIDYLVVHHTELDHSGSILKLLELNPSITIVCTAAAQKYLKAILNQEFHCLTVKHGQSISIGEDKLDFIVAPLLHWPDSMMTWFSKDQTLFSCDFLGCHFCEPTMLDKNLHYKKEYLEQFAYYYKGIFGPFKPYVLAGLEKIQHLPIQRICPSHGPVLVQEMQERLSDYKKWSTPEPKHNKSIVILYASAYGCTKLLAQIAAEELRAKSAYKIDLIDAVSTPLSQACAKVAEADALFVGSCTINKDAPKVIWDILTSIDAINTKGKVAGVFGSYGWSGEAVQMIKDRLLSLHYNVVLDQTFKVNFMPTEDDLNQMRNYVLSTIAKL